jgi:hypothetical protein
VSEHYSRSGSAGAPGFMHILPLPDLDQGCKWKIVPLSRLRPAQEFTFEL